MSVRGRLWGWTVGALAASGVMLVVAFVVSFVLTGGAYEASLARLFWVNVVVAALLAVVIALVALRLVRRLRQGKFGSRLLLKLAGILAFVGLLPGLLTYAVSYQFVNRSIAALFDEKISGALDAGIGLGRLTMSTLEADLEAQAALAAQQLAGGDAGAVLALERLRSQLGAEEVALVSAAGVNVASASRLPTLGAGLTAAPPPSVWRRARQLGRASGTEGLEESPEHARIVAVATVPAPAMQIGPGETRYLVVTRALPATLAQQAITVQAAYRDYQERALARGALRRMVLGTLTLALVLSVFASTLLAILLGNQIARPLLLLADGVRHVAAGDLSARPVFASGDELGGLTRSFADMTQQLADARAAVQAGVAELSEERERLQTLLDNLSSGVIVLDRDGRIDLANPAATRILREPIQAWRGQRLDAIEPLDEFAREVLARFPAEEAAGAGVAPATRVALVPPGAPGAPGDPVPPIATTASAGTAVPTVPTAAAGTAGAASTAPTDDPGEREQWQDAIELRAGHADAVTLLARGAHLPDAARLLVFDDITEVVSAQRTQAWSEVARRVAHEIKNPLTPIQLSAERLEHKLASKLQEADRAMLARSVATIVAQVQAMKTLVNEFRDYARLPAAQLAPLQLNDVVHEVLGLYGAELERGRLGAQLDARLPRILGDAPQLRQVIHNLVQNALDAIAEQADGRVQVATSAPVAGGRQFVRLTIVDNGPGFAEHVLRRAFEPYVTTKAKGTGLGLPVVRKIAEEHRARVMLSNLPPPEPPTTTGPAEAPGVIRPLAGGARVSLSFSLLEHDARPGT